MEMERGRQTVMRPCLTDVWPTDDWGLEWIGVGDWRGAVRPRRLVQALPLARIACIPVGAGLRPLCIVYLKM